MDGLLLFNKPILWTSHDAVDFLRRRTGQRAVGHAGTLDPLATGLLVILLGKWTKRADEYMGLDKSYEGTILLGVETDSYDLDGRICPCEQPAAIDAKKIEAVFARFTGDSLQTPPAYSAIKKAGKKLYELARQGQTVEVQARPIVIREFFLNYFHENEIAFSLSCSKGTYVRSLAHEVGRTLGCGGVLSSLVRTRIGSFYLKDALSEADLKIMSYRQIEEYLNENISRISRQSTAV